MIFLILCSNNSSALPMIDNDLIEQDINNLNITKYSQNIDWTKFTVGIIKQQKYIFIGFILLRLAMMCLILLLIYFVRLFIEESFLGFCISNNQDKSNLLEDINRDQEEDDVYQAIYKDYYDKLYGKNQQLQLKKFYNMQQAMHVNSLLKKQYEHGANQYIEEAKKNFKELKFLKELEYKDKKNFLENSGYKDILVQNPYEFVKQISDKKIKFIQSMINVMEQPITIDISVKNSILSKMTQNNDLKLILKYNPYFLDQNPDNSLFSLIKQFIVYEKQIIINFKIQDFIKFLNNTTINQNFKDQYKCFAQEIVELNEKKLYSKHILNFIMSDNNTLQDVLNLIFRVNNVEGFENIDVLIKSKLPINIQQTLDNIQKFNVTQIEQIDTSKLIDKFELEQLQNLRNAFLQGHINETNETTYQQELQNFEQMEDSLATIHNIMENFIQIIKEDKSIAEFSQNFVGIVLKNLLQDKEFHKLKKSQKFLEKIKLFNNNFEDILNFIFQKTPNLQSYNLDVMSEVISQNILQQSERFILDENIFQEVIKYQVKQIPENENLNLEQDIKIVFNLLKTKNFFKKNQIVFSSEYSQEILEEQFQYQKIQNIFNAFDKLKEIEDIFFKYQDLEQNQILSQEEIYTIKSQENHLVILDILVNKFKNKKEDLEKQIVFNKINQDLRYEYNNIANNQDIQAILNKLIQHYSVSFLDINKKIIELNNLINGFVKEQKDILNQNETINVIYLVASRNLLFFLNEINAMNVLDFLNGDYCYFNFNLSLIPYEFRQACNKAFKEMFNIAKIFNLLNFQNNQISQDNMSRIILPNDLKLRLFQVNKENQLFCLNEFFQIKFKQALTPQQKLLIKEELGKILDYLIQNNYVNNYGYGDKYRNNYGYQKLLEIPSIYQDTVSFLTQDLSEEEKTLFLKEENFQNILEQILFENNIKIWRYRKKLLVEQVEKLKDKIVKNLNKEKNIYISKIEKILGYNDELKDLTALKALWDFNHLMDINDVLQIIYDISENFDKIQSEIQSIVLIDSLRNQELSEFKKIFISKLKNKIFIPYQPNIFKKIKNFFKTISVSLIDSLTEVVIVLGVLLTIFINFICNIIFNLLINLNSKDYGIIYYKQLLKNDVEFFLDKSPGELLGKMNSLSVNGQKMFNTIFVEVVGKVFDIIFCFIFLSIFTNFFRDVYLIFYTYIAYNLINCLFIYKCILKNIRLYISLINNKQTQVNIFIDGTINVISRKIFHTQKEEKEIYEKTIQVDNFIMKKLMNVLLSEKFLLFALFCGYLYFMFKLKSYIISDINRDIKKKENIMKRLLSAIKINIQFLKAKYTKKKGDNYTSIISDISPDLSLILFNSDDYIAFANSEFRLKEFFEVQETPISKSLNLINEYFRKFDNDRTISSGWINEVLTFQKLEFFDFISILEQKYFNININLLIVFIFYCYIPFQTIRLYFNSLTIMNLVYDYIYSLDLMSKDLGFKRGKLKLEGDTTIQINHLAKSYEDAHILRDINFQINPKDKLMLSGRTGGGKTTLISLLSGLIYQTGGEILINGHNLLEYDPSSLASNFVYVPQQCILYDETIRNNVSIGLSSYSEENFLKACELCQVDIISKKKEDGYNAKVGNAGSKLSGGERQRVLLARAVLRILEGKKKGINKNFQINPNIILSQQICEEQTQPISFAILMYQAGEKILINGHNLYAYDPNIFNFVYAPRKYSLFNVINKSNNKETNKIKIAIFDEITSCLDENTSRLIVNNIKEITEDIIVIWISHEKIIQEIYKDELKMFYLINGCISETAPAA